MSKTAVDPLGSAAGAATLARMGPFPDEMKRLVEQFHNQRDRLRADDYNETKVRIDFIDPMMSALG
jgi:hypothetical protein